MEFIRGYPNKFEKLLEQKTKKLFAKYELFSFKHYSYDCYDKPFVYLIEYFTDINYKNKIAEWKYDGKIGKII